MAINKNFVIKNGVQVSTDLIIGDADTNKVGIGTTVPHYDLHVGVARGSRGGIGVTDAVVAGVATINQLSVTGISTFAGALDVNSTVDFAADVVFNGTNDITYDQSESALVFNDNAAIRVGTSSDFSIMHDGSNTILRERGTGALKILSNSVELLGATAGETLAKFNENGNVELYHDNTKHFEVVAIGATVFGDFIVSGVTTSKELNVSSGSTFGGNVDVNANIDVSGNSVLNGDVDLGNATSDTITATGRFDSDIVPSTDGARDLGSSTLEFKDLYVDGVGYIDQIESDGGQIGNIQIGETGDNEIDTASLNLILDSAGGTINIDDNLTVAGVTTFSGIGSFGTDMNVGITTFFVDKSTGRIGIGTNVPTAALEIGKTAGTGIGVSIFDNGNVAVSGILTVGGDLDVKGDITYDEITGRNLNITGITTLAGTSNFNGDVNLGNATSDTITPTGRFDGDIVPSSDGAIDLGASGLEFKDLFIDGTANIDTLDVDGTSNFADDVTLVAAGSSTILFDASAHSLIFQDNIRAKFGTGSDLSVYHDGSHSYIQDTGTGSLIAAANQFEIKNAANSALGLRYIENSSVELFHNGSGRLITTVDGASVGTGVSFYTNGNIAAAGIVTANGGLSVGSNGSAGVAVSAYTNGNFAASGIATVGGALLVGAGITVSGDILPNADGSRDLGSATLEFQDLFIDGTANIDSLAADSAAIGDLTADRVVIAGTSGELEDDANFTYDGSILKIAAGAGASIHNTGNAAFVGVVTAGRGFAIGIQSASLDVAKNVGISTLNFIGAGNTFKVTGQTLDISIAGGGGGGGVTAVETAVSSTSATSTGTFAKATYRSAAVIAQITQGSAYQVGRYLVIHDGTTVTTVEESAVATGSMLGTFEGVINGSNVEFRVTMSSSSSATVTTKIDTVDIP